MGDRTGQPKRIDDFSKTIGAFASHYHHRYEEHEKVTEVERKKRQENAPQIADAYYDWATVAYEFNWNTSIHYTPFPPAWPPSDSTLATAMQFTEHKLAFMTQLRPGMKVLDVGCGIGGPARTIAKFVGCEIVGISINQRQVDRAILLTALEGLQHKCTFLRADFNNMPFLDESFDAAYAIEATVHAPTLLQVYKEVARVLKPNAPFGCIEWVMTPKFDPSDETHLSIRNQIEHGNGVTNLQNPDQARAQFLAAGFDIDHEEDFTAHFDYVKEHVDRVHNNNNKTTGTTSEDEATTTASSPILIPFSSGGPRPAPPPSTPLPSPLPIPQLTTFRHWTFPLTGHHELATTWTDWWLVFKMSTTARRLCTWFVWVGEKVGFVDKGVMEAMKTMALNVDSARVSGEMGLFSPSWWFIGRKRSAQDGEGRGEGNGEDGEVVGE